VAALRRAVSSTPRTASLQRLAQEVVRQPLVLEAVLRAAVQSATLAVVVVFSLISCIADAGSFGNETGARARLIFEFNGL
jgi:hypothetical protein